MEPIAALLSRAQAELSASFDFGKPMRISRAPGRLDVIGGIADYTGSLVCEMPLDRAAAVLLQQRDDRLLQIFSFNLFDKHLPFTFCISIDDLARPTSEELQREFNQPGRKWAGYIAGCLFILHEQGLIDLRDPSFRGMNLALLSTVPMGAGISSSAAIEVATMMNLLHQFVREGEAFFGDGQASAEPKQPVDPGSAGASPSRALHVAQMCQQVENRIVGAPCGIMDQVTSLLGNAGSLLRLLCQPHELQPALVLPDNVRVIGINSGVKHDVAGPMYSITRCAAFMGHAMILQKMRDMGAAAGKALERDPMNGYLANLNIGDFKRYFRPWLPELMKGREFIERFGSTIDAVTKVEPDVEYHVQGATDHHVLEAHRVRSFCAFLEQAAAQPPGTRSQGELLDKAGHMMYASHMSYTNDARLGADECDLMVELVRKHEPAGLYGAKITGGGSGGTVAVMCDRSGRADEAIEQILRAYQRQSGRTPDLFSGTSRGAWWVGTGLL